MVGGVLLLMGVLVQQQAGKGLFGDSKTEQTASTSGDADAANFWVSDAENKKENNPAPKDFDQAAPPPAPVMNRGWLSMNGNRHWFVLHSDGLDYFKWQSDTEQEGHLELSDIVDVVDFTLQFQIIAKDWIVDLTARTKGEVQTWTRKLREATSLVTPETNKKAGGDLGLETRLPAPDMALADYFVDHEVEHDWFSSKLSQKEFYGRVAEKGKERIETFKKVDENHDGGINIYESMNNMLGVTTQFEVLAHYFDQRDTNHGMSL
jgi:hypothetical protein